MTAQITVDHKMTVLIAQMTVQYNHQVITH